MPVKVGKTIPVSEGRWENRKQCPIPGTQGYEPCGDWCAWYVDGECALAIIAKEMKRRDKNEHP